MFGSGSIGQSDMAEERCLPDYEAQAKRLKKTIDANKECLSGMVTGLHHGSVYLDREQATLFHATIGYLYVNIPNLEKEYDNILKKIEEHK